MLTFSCCGKESALALAEQTQLLRGIQRGYERECLRVDANGKLALTFHPSALGSKLTHPWITTDYSEALLEFITCEYLFLNYPGAAEQQLTLARDKV